MDIVRRTRPQIPRRCTHRPTVLQRRRRTSITTSQPVRRRRLQRRQSISVVDVADATADGLIWSSQAADVGVDVVVDSRGSSARCLNEGADGGRREVATDAVGRRQRDVDAATRRRRRPTST